MPSSKPKALLPDSRHKADYNGNRFMSLLLSDRINRIKPSPSVVARATVVAMQAQGRDIIDLTIGEPDYDTPDHIKQAGVDAIWAGHTKYTPVSGILPLRQAVADKFRRENGIEYAASQIFVGSGAKQVIYNALACTINHGDEVVVPAPYWVSYPDMVQLFGGVAVIAPTSRSQGYKLTPEALEAAVTPRTRWLIMNAPCNPTGAAYTAAELNALADVLRRHPHVWVITDDIYEHLFFAQGGFFTLAKVAPDLADRTLTVNGVSKAYAMTGWRIGYAGGPKELIEAMTKLQSQSTSCVSSISQHAAIAALNGPQDCVKEKAAMLHERRDAALKTLRDAPGLECMTPDGAFYLFPSCDDVIGKRTPDGQVIRNDADFMLYLLESQGVAVIDGASYGMSPSFRLSIATSIESLTEGCRRIVQACKMLQ
jgi:aspartate aminotransferase